MQLPNVLSKSVFLDIPKEEASHLKFYVSLATNKTSQANMQSVHIECMSMRLWAVTKVPGVPVFARWKNYRQWLCF